MRKNNYFIIVFLLISSFNCVNSQSNQIVKSIDESSRISDTYICIEISPFHLFDSVGIASKAKFYFDELKKNLRMVTITLNDDQQSLLCYKFYYSEERDNLTNVELRINGSCENCYGSYYFMNEELFFKKESMIEIHDIAPFLLINEILKNVAKNLNI